MNDERIRPFDFLSHKKELHTGIYPGPQPEEEEGNKNLTEETAVGWTGGCSALSSVG